MAYDNKDRETLYRETLMEEGVPTQWVDLLREMYSDNKVICVMREKKSKWCGTNRGLRQGCPASSTLFLPYIERMAREVVDKGVGFRWEYRKGEVLKVPILFFADDGLLLANTFEELQLMLDAAGEAAENSN